MKINYYRNNIQKIFFFIFSVLLSQQINCLIEFPIEIIKTKSSFEYISTASIPKIFIEEGITKISSNYLFLANIKIGSKFQPFRLILDTGSSITWIADGNSNIQSSSKIKNFFDPSSSSSCILLSEMFNIKYGTGECSGYYFIDTIKYLNNKQFKLKIGLARNALFDFEEADGIIGLSRISEDKETSFINRLYIEKIIDNKMFSLKFATNNREIPMGKMFIGRHDDFNKKNSFSCDLIEKNKENKYFWTCELKYFALSKSNYLLSSNQTVNIIFDTGTNFIFLPYDYLQEIESDLDKIGCKINEFTDKSKDNNNLDKMGFRSEFRLVCSSYKLPQIQFLLGNTKFTIPNHLAFYFEGGNAYSYILFVISDKRNRSPYIFGSPFFMSFHTLFNNDNKKMEFYPLDPSYLILKSENILGKVVVIFAIITILIIFIFMIFYAIKIKREENKNQYQNINGNDINIEMVGK